MLRFDLKSVKSSIFSGCFPLNYTQKQSDCSVMILIDKWATSTYGIAYYSWVIVNQTDTNYHRLSMKRSEVRNQYAVLSIEKMVAERSRSDVVPNRISWFLNLCSFILHPFSIVLFPLSLLLCLDSTQPVHCSL